MGLEIIKNITPRESVASAARNCYSSKFIYPEDTITWISKKNNTDKLVKDLLFSNHNTTFEHFYITFKITGYSRHFFWRYLHGINDFYSTDQQSQRYVKLNEQNFYYPSFLEKEDKEKWKQFYKYIYSMYEELIEDIEKYLEKNTKTDKFKRKKIAQELSRYIIPLGQTPHATWTVNFITIIRYIAVLKSLKENHEIKEEALKFAEELKYLLLNYANENSSEIKKFLNKNLAKINEEFINLKKEIENIKIYNKNLKEDILKLNEKISIIEKKMEVNENYEKVYIDLINTLIDIELKKINIEDFWNYKINMKLFKEKPNIVNINFGGINEIFEESNIEYPFYPLNKGSKSLITFTTTSLVSHSMDSQNQRHRTTIKLRPLLKDFYNKLENKYYIPRLFKEDKKLLEKYKFILNHMYSFFEEQAKKYGFNNVLYLLPNSQYVAIIDMDNMEYYTHKAMKRLCFNSQEEIWHYTYNQILELEKKGIDINKLNLLPPCQVRRKYNKKPYCEEGNRYCGNAIWKKDFKKLTRIF